MNMLIAILATRPAFVYRSRVDPHDFIIAAYYHVPHSGPTWGYARGTEADGARISDAEAVELMRGDAYELIFKNGAELP